MKKNNFNYDEYNEWANSDFSDIKSSSDDENRKKFKKMLVSLERKLMRDNKRRRGL